MKRTLSFTIALICLGVLLAACTMNTEVNDKQVLNLKNRVLQLTSADNNLMLGKTFYAGYLSKDMDFKSSERVLLTSVGIRAFTCNYHDPAGNKLLKSDIWCHFFGVFSFQDMKGNSKVFKTLMKIRANSDLQILAEKEIFSLALNRAFSTKNPFRLGHYRPYFMNLKKRKLAVGMPSEYLRLIWGHPDRVVNLTIDKSGRSETYVYPRYFVLLLNGVVESIHKFDDLDMDKELISKI